jgi:hypothetical protein
MTGNGSSDRSRWASCAGVGAALAAGFCCIGAPLSAAGMVGAAGLAVAIEPLRPLFLMVSAGFLVLAFWLGRAGGSARFLWVATALAIALGSLPLWIRMLE